MSAKMVRRFKAHVERDAIAARERAARAEREAERKAMHCDRCETRLLSPAALCGFCMEDGGALADETASAA